MKANEHMSRLHEIVPRPLVQDLKFAGVQQVFWLLFMSIILDGGDLFRWSTSAFGGYWLGITAIALRRLPYGSRTDRWFVRYSSIPLAILAAAIEPIVHRYTHWAFVSAR
jgi:hypothetical protein